MKHSFHLLSSLFLTFLKIGAFTFGGGYAMIPLIQKEAVERRHWIENEDILDIVAIAESTPGPIAINAATFVGYRVCGIPGALCCTLGIVLPSLIIIALIARILQSFSSSPIVRYAFFGIRAGVLALIVKALLSMYKQSSKSVFSLSISLFAFVMVFILKLSILLTILACACAGLAYSMLQTVRKQK